MGLTHLFSLLHPDHVGTWQLEARSPADMAKAVCKKEARQDT